MPQPSVGRIVHYVSRATCDPVCRAAIITEVGAYPPGVSEADKENIAVPVDVTVFLPDTSFNDRGVMQSEGGRDGGTWHWPERV